MQVPRVLNRMDRPAPVGPPGKLLLSAVSLVSEGGRGGRGLGGRDRGWKERPEGHGRTRGESEVGASPVSHVLGSGCDERALPPRVARGCYRRVTGADAEVPTQLSSGVEVKQRKSD